MIKLTSFGTYGNMPDYPPPPSFFLVYTSLALFSFAIPGKRGARQIESSSSTTVTSADFFNPQCQLFVANFDDSRPHWYRSGTVINQLFPDFRGIRNRGKDVWQILEFNPIVFWYMTGETAEAMVEKVYLDVTAPRHLPHTPKTDKRRRCILDARNRALLVIIWLRQYLKLHVLAHMCQISKSTVAEEIIYHIVPVLILNFRHYMYHMT